MNYFFNSSPALSSTPLAVSPVSELVNSLPSPNAMQSYGVCNMVEDSWCNYFFNSASGLSSTPLAISPVSEIVLSLPSINTMQS